MSDTVKRVIKTLLIVLIVSALVVLVGYLLIIRSVNTRVESIQAQLIKSVSDNNYMTKDTYRTTLDIFETIVKSTASDESQVIRVENGVINRGNGASVLDDLIVGIYINYTDDLGTGDKLCDVKAQGNVRAIRVRVDFRQIQFIRFGSTISEVSAKRSSNVHSVYFDNPASCLRYIK